MLGWNCGYAFCSNVSAVLTVLVRHKRLWLIMSTGYPDYVWCFVRDLSRDISCQRQGNRERIDWHRRETICDIGT